MKLIPQNSGILCSETNDPNVSRFNWSTHMWHTDWRMATA